MALIICYNRLRIDDKVFDGDDNFQQVRDNDDVEFNERDDRSISH